MGVTNEIALCLHIPVRFWLHTVEFLSPRLRASHNHHSYVQWRGNFALKIRWVLHAIVKLDLCKTWRKKHSKPIFLATALSRFFACTLWGRQIPCSRAALAASRVLLPEEEPARIQTAPTDCIRNYIIQAKQLDCSLKSSDCHVLIFVLSTKERKRKKSCFSQSFVLASLFIRLCLLDRDFAVIGFFDMYFYCFSSERRRWLKIKRIVH